MPFSGEHACRLRPPGDFQDDSFRRTSREHEGKRYDVIMGRLKGETTMTEQAFRYPKDTWEPSEARSHCQDHEGTFEAASEDEEALQSQDVRQMEMVALDDYRRGLAAAPVLYRGLGDGYRNQSPEASDGLVQFVASEENEDRLGSIIRAEGWELDNFRHNPVFLYIHDQTFPPLGVVTNTEVRDKQLLATVRFDDKDDFAALIHRKYAEGFMRGVSVGFRALEFEKRERDTQAIGDIHSLLIVFTKTELVEISAAPVPANPKTLKKALGQRSRFWIPFTPEVNVRFDSAPLQASIDTLNRSVADMLAKLIPVQPTTPGPGATADDDWHSFLEELRQITTQGGTR